MELKLVETNVIHKRLYLLIVPYGIETGMLNLV